MELPARRVTLVPHVASFSNRQSESPPFVPSDGEDEIPDRDDPPSPKPKSKLKSSKSAAKGKGKKRDASAPAEPPTHRTPKGRPPGQRYPPYVQDPSVPAIPYQQLARYLNPTGHFVSRPPSFLLSLLLTARLARTWVRKLRYPQQGVPLRPSTF